MSIFGALLFGFGLLATHFTRKASLVSAVVSTERAVVSLLTPVVWAVLLGIAMVASAAAVSRWAPGTSRARAAPAVSWWVLYAGGAAYAAGALIAWATNWAP